MNLFISLFNGADLLRLGKYPEIETIEKPKWGYSIDVIKKGSSKRQLKILVILGGLGIFLGILMTRLIDDFYFGVLVILSIFISYFFALEIMGAFTYKVEILVSKRPYRRFIHSAWMFYFSILQHFHLRWLLYRKGLLPLRLVRFLNEATKYHILESDGGTWRFRHKILQDYFADQGREKYAAQEES